MTPFHHMVTMAVVRFVGFLEKTRRMWWWSIARWQLCGGGDFSGGFRYGVQLLKKYLSNLIKTLTATFLKQR